MDELTNILLDIIIADIPYANINPFSRILYKDNKRISIECDNTSRQMGLSMYQTGSHDHELLKIRYYQSDIIRATPDGPLIIMNVDNKILIYIELFPRRYVLKLMIDDNFSFDNIKNMSDITQLIHNSTDIEYDKTKTVRDYLLGNRTKSARKI